MAPVQLARNEEIAALLRLADKERSTARQAAPCAHPGTWVIWQVTCSATMPGDELMLVGSAQSLGSWTPEQGCRLTTRPDQFPVWHGITRLEEAELKASWKIVIRRAGGDACWEPGNDRSFHLLGLSQHGQQRSERSCGFCGPQRTYFIGAQFGQVQETTPPLEIERCSCGVCDAETPSTTATSTAGSWAESPSNSLAVSQSDASERGQTFSEKHWLWIGANKIGKPTGDCEDAYFVSDTGIVVSDGVGSMIQYASYGVDCAAFASELVELAGRALQPEMWEQMSEGVDNPAVQRAVAAVRAADCGVRAFGAATITAVSFWEEDGKPSIGAANLGDSGFIVLRHRTEPGNRTMEIVTRSKEQQHRWNCPYQLLRLPRALKARTPKSMRYDTADDCDTYHCALQPGDLLLVFTDGFSDNLSEEKMLEVISQAQAAATQSCTTQEQGLHPMADPGSLAKALSLAAQMLGMDRTAEVPFAKTARACGQDHWGGKEDDVTVVAAWVMLPKASLQEEAAAASSLAELRSAVELLGEEPLGIADTGLQSVEGQLAGSGMSRCHTLSAFSDLVEATGQGQVEATFQGGSGTSKVDTLGMFAEMVQPDDGQQDEALAPPKEAQVGTGMTASQKKAQVGIGISTEAAGNRRSGLSDLLRAVISNRCLAPQAATQA